MKLLLCFVISIFFACNSKKVFKELAQTNKIDQDIILIGIGNSNRSEIADLLLNIERCNPLILGIDVIFPMQKQSLEDSILANSLQKVSNEILAYRFDSTGKEERSIDRFRRFANDEGYVDLDRREGVSSHFTPLKKVEAKLYESFALKIIKHWKPEFKYNFTVDKSIPILFQRSLQQYYYFVKEDLLDKNVCDLLKNKIVLVGYLGPGDEDKHFTPIRNDAKDIEGNPDTYGLVIQANAIRTILEFAKKD